MKIVWLFFNNKLTGDKSKMANGRSDFKKSHQLLVQMLKESILDPM